MADIITEAKDYALKNYVQNISSVGENIPEYTKRGSESDRLAIMFCEILVWNYKREKDKEPDLFTIPEDALRITEVLSVDINKSYKKLIQTATVTLPRGAVIGKKKAGEKIKVGDGTSNKEETELKAATQGGDLQTTQSNSTAKGEDIVGVQAKREDTGIIVVTKNQNEGLADSTDLAPGQRIEIRMAYAYNEEDYNKLMSKDRVLIGDLEFSGFITKCSVDSPLIVECEDLASMLKKIPCPTLKPSRNYTVNDFCKEGGAHYLLKGSGLKLDSKTASTTIHVGQIGLTKDLVAADVLDQWSKCGLFAFINEQTTPPSIRVGRVYTSNFDYGNGANVMVAKGGLSIIQSDWDVASDNLKVMQIDKKWLAVKANGLNKEWKYFSLVVRKSEESNATTDDNWDVINVVKPVKKGQAMKKNKPKTANDGSANASSNTVNETGLKVENEPKISLDNYSVVTCQADKVGITRDELVNFAKNYYRHYNPNGISGSVTLFGDRKINITDTIGYIDKRYPERNGYYFVESVHITFSVNGGFRKEITLPYKVSNFKNNIKTIE